MKNHFSIEDAAAELAKHRLEHNDPNSHQACFANLFRHGTLEVELFQPIDVDKQQPHTKDELYVIATGSGHFTMTGFEQRKVVPGDVLFVPAGVEHRFVDFSKDFSTWVFLYGPQGGEAQAS